MRTTPETRLVVSLASRQHNLSARMWNAAFEDQGLDMLHLPREVDADDIYNALAGVRALGVIGAVISLPHKEAVLQLLLLDAYSNEARAIGAVNTITTSRPDNGPVMLTGHNTDWLGAVRALEPMTTLRGQRIAVLGAGGLSRAITYGLGRVGAHVDIFNRTPETGQEVAARFNTIFPERPRVTARDIRELGRTGTYNAVVQATSVGYGTAESLVNPEVMRSLGRAGELIVMDGVIMPVETTFLRTAATCGYTTIPGYQMLLDQVGEQFRLFTGQEAPLAVMKDALLTGVNEMRTS